MTDNKLKCAWNVHRQIARYAHNGGHAIPSGMNVDHIDNNALNNAASNLRIVSVKVNQANKKSKGYYKTKYGTFIAQAGLLVDGHRRQISKTFKSESDAKEWAEKRKKEYIEAVEAEDRTCPSVETPLMITAQGGWELKALGVMRRRCIELENELGRYKRKFGEL